MTSTKNILITGGAGFIGSHLTEALLNSDNRVTILDNFNDYYPPELKHQNLKISQSHPQFTLITGDILDAKLVAEVFDSQSFDIVIHLAARAGVRPSLENPRLYWQVNLEGTLNILESMRHTNVQRLIFASSSSIYGNRAKGPFHETDNTDLAVSPYGATKKAGEVLVHTYSHLYQIQATCLRFFTVFGPRNRPDMACFKFLHAIHRGLPITQYGDGTTGRDYTFVDDIISGIISSLDQEGLYEIYNLGNSSPILLRDMISTIESVVGKSAKIDQLPMQPGDVQLTFASIAKAQKDLNYQPETTFKEGITKLYQWYQQNLDLINSIKI